MRSTAGISTRRKYWGAFASFVLNIALALTILTLLCCSGEKDRKAVRLQDLWTAIELDTLPDLGDKWPRTPEDLNGFQIMTLISPASFTLASLVEVEGMRYYIGPDSDSSIIFIRTADTCFATPEGVSTGDALADVLRIADKEIKLEPGWAYFVELPSGWRAGFSVANWDTDTLTQDARVSLLFKRSW